MDLFITEKETGKKIAFSLLPDSLDASSETNMSSYNFINIGEVKFPNGQKLRTYSWSGTLPGISKKKLSFVKSQHWKAPKELINTFDSWRIKGTKLVLMLTETVINCDVYLSKFEHKYSGGSGDVTYDIEFIEAKDVKIYTIQEAAKTPSNQSSNTSSNTRPATQTNTSTSTKSEQTKTYTVKKGDCLWNIAQKYLGSGARYMEIYNLNKKVIGSNPSLIYAGQVLVLPN